MGHEVSEKEMWKQLPSTEGRERAKLLLDLSNKALERRSANEALALAESAKELYDSLGATVGSVERAQAIQGVSYSLKELNRNVEAATVLEEAVKLYRESNDPYVDDYLRLQARWYSEVGDWEAALACQLEAVKLNEIEGDQVWLARSLYFVANAYGHLKHWDESIRTYKNAREIFKSLKQVPEVSWCDQHIGEGYVELGDGVEGLMYGERALEVGKIRMDIPRIMKAHFVVARSKVLLGDYDGAEEDFSDISYGASAGEAVDWEIYVASETQRKAISLQQGNAEKAEEIEKRIATIREIIE
jgi:tetratricopeptide (TPR) repeat protein